MKLFIPIIVSVFLFCNSRLTAKNVNVKSFGATGNGRSDDAAAIHRAVQNLRNGDVLYFPVGTYNASITKNKGSIINLTGCKNITIKGEGASIVVRPNGFTNYNIIYSENCNKLSIIGFKLCGDRLDHDYKTTKSTHEFGYGIYIVGNKPGKKSNITISDCEIYNMTGDAIVTKNGISGGKIVINECILHHCRRQGISILDSDNVTIRGCQIHHIGSSDGIKGTAPMAGIDIEPASGTKIVNKVNIENTNIFHNDYLSIVGRPNILLLSNSTIEDISLHTNKVNGLTPLGKIENVTFQTSSSRRHYFYASGIVWTKCNIQYEPSPTSEYCEIYAKKLYKCNIKGKISPDSQKCILGCRSESEKCIFENICISNSNSYLLEPQKGNIYKKCTFLFYSPPKVTFFSCSFIQCKTDEKSSKIAAFKNCSMDSIIFEIRK